MNYPGKNEGISPGYWTDQPDKEDDLELIVEWEHITKQSVKELFTQSEH